MVEDPTSYDEAVTDIDADMWQQAMKSELDSMYSNQVWELVDEPDIPLNTPEPRRSGRTPRQPDRYLGVSSKTDYDDMVEDPTSYDRSGNGYRC